MTANLWPCRPRTIERLLTSHGLSRAEAKALMHAGRDALADRLTRDPVLARALQAAEAAEQAGRGNAQPAQPASALARGLGRIAGALLRVASAVDGRQA